MTSGYLYCFTGIIKREVLRFFQQRSRLLSALVRPLLWLVVFASGFRAALGVSIMEPYGTYITYQEYYPRSLLYDYFIQWHAKLTVHGL